MDGAACAAQRDGLEMPARWSVKRIASESTTRPQPHDRHNAAGGHSVRRHSEVSREYEVDCSDHCFVRSLRQRSFSRALRWGYIRIACGMLSFPLLQSVQTMCPVVQCILVDWWQQLIELCSCALGSVPTSQFSLHWHSSLEITSHLL
jgi:hypothetical protein